MKNLSLKIFALLVIVVCAGGCSLVSQIKKQMGKSEVPKVISATDGSCSLTVPGSWRTQINLHEEAKLQAANVVAEQYAIVISENKFSFDSSMTLDEYTDLVIEGPKETVTDLKISEPVSLEVNSYPARQFEATGQMEKIKIKWIFTTIQAPKSFHQIVMWTKEASFEKNKGVFYDIVKSFKETDPKENPAGKNKGEE